MQEVTWEGTIQMQEGTPKMGEGMTQTSKWLQWIPQDVWRDTTQVFCNCNFSCRDSRKNWEQDGNNLTDPYQDFSQDPTRNNI